MANTIPYDQFDSAKNDNLWSGTSVTPHQSNSALGVTDLLFVGGNQVSGNVQATQFANKLVSFVWGFSVCTDPNAGTGTTVTTQVVGNPVRALQAGTSGCPNSKPVSF